MKAIFLFLLAAGLFISCNNSTPEPKKDDVTKETKDNNNTIPENNNTPNNNNTPSKNGWSEDDKKDFLSTCTNEMQQGNEVQSYCSCLLNKAVAAFSSYEELKNSEDPESKLNINDCVEKYPAGARKK